MLTGMISPALISLFVQRKTIGWLGILECWLEQVHRLTPAILRNSTTSPLWLVFPDRMGRINSLCGWKINFYAVWIHFLFWERHSRASGGVRIVRWAPHRAAHWAPKH